GEREPRALQECPARTEGGCVRPRAHALGDGARRDRPVHARRSGRGSSPRHGPRRRGSDRGHTGDRRTDEDPAFAVRLGRHAREPDRRAVPGSGDQHPHRLDRLPGGRPADLLAGDELRGAADRPSIRREAEGLLMAAQPQLLSAGGRGRHRKRVNRMVEASWLIAAGIAVAVLTIVTASVFLKGIKALNLDLFAKTPVTFGETGGGIAHAFVGSLVLGVLPRAVALPG